MTFKNGYFHEGDGMRFLPFGIFGNYFRAEYTGDTLVLPSRHGSGAIEFQRCTREVWEHFFAFLQKEGVNTIRLFPRGDSGGSAWEGLDIGGRLNRSLFDLILLYAQTAREYGIHTVLGLFTQPECSVYCRKDTRVYWGQRLFEDDMRREVTPSQRRFLDNADDLVDYNDFFSDPDVRSCCHSYLDEILPLLSGNRDIIALELYNEMGWASPNANPENTFRWELTPDFLDWSRDMAEHVKRLAPEMPVLISNPGVGLLGHDPIQWAQAIRPDIYSFHNYPDICGAPDGMDYAAISDMCLNYTAAACPVMFGEWEAVFRPKPEEIPLLTLCARDFAWFSVLSGAPGCISWRARGYGQYKAVTALFRELEGRDLTRAAGKHVINISEAQEYFASLVDGGSEECSIDFGKWCPDWQATDGKHRFCVKAQSAFHKKLAEIEQCALQTGADFRFSLTEGKPLMDWQSSDFADDGLVSVPAGYHQKNLYAADGKTVITYLRNTVPVPYYGEKDGRTFEKFCFRTQTEQKVVLELRDTAFSYRLYDLDTGETRALRAGSNDLGTTSHDFVILSIK